MGTRRTAAVAVVCKSRAVGGCMDTLRRLNGMRRAARILVLAAAIVGCSGASVDAPSATPGRCEVSETSKITDSLGTALGTGPVYPILGSSTVSIRDFSPDESGQYRMKVIWAATAAYSGPATITGGRTDQGAVLEFSPSRLGDATVLDLPTTSSLRPPDLPVGWRVWTAYTRFRVPGCYEWHISGNNMETAVTFEITA